MIHGFCSGFTAALAMETVMSQRPGWEFVAGVLLLTSVVNAAVAWAKDKAQKGAALAKT